jgi:type IV pilus assembly protein PilX
MTIVNPVAAWENVVSWTSPAGSGGASSTRTVLPATQYSTLGSSSFLPSRPPECVAETQTLGVAPNTFTAIVVTARGFSPDYSADVNGQTTAGSVVWLQSILNL